MKKHNLLKLFVGALALLFMPVSILSGVSSSDTSTSTLTHLGNETKKGSGTIHAGTDYATYYASQISSLAQLATYGITLEKCTLSFKNISSQIEFSIGSTRSSRYSTNMTSASVWHIKYRNLFYWNVCYKGNYFYKDSKSKDIDWNQASSGYTANDIFCMYFPSDTNPYQDFYLDASSHLFFYPLNAAQATYFSTSGPSTTASDGLVPNSVDDPISFSQTTFDVTYGNGSTNLADFLNKGNAGSYYYSVSSGNSCSANISTGLVTYDGYGKSVVTCIKTGDGIYKTSTCTATFNVSRAGNSVTFNDINATYGDANVTLGASGHGTGAISYTSSNTSVGSISNTNVLTIGNVGTSTITASQAQSDQYNTASKSATLTVSKKSFTISTTPTVSSITYGQSLGDSTISGDTSFDVSLLNGNRETVTGTWSWKEGASTIPNAGTANHVITFTPTSSNFNSVDKIISLTVDKKTLEVSTALSLLSKSDTSVTLNSITYAKYYYSTDGTNWTEMSSATADGLSANTTYYFRYQLVAPDSNYTDSSFSDSFEVKTKISTANTPAPTGISVNYATKELVGLKANIAYLINGTQYVSSSTGTIDISSTFMDSKHEVLTADLAVQYASTDTNMASQTTTISKMNKETNPGTFTFATVATSDGKVTLSGMDTTYEYSLDGGATYTKCTGTTLELDPSTSESSSSYVQVRKSATATTPVSSSKSLRIPLVAATPTGTIDYLNSQITGLEALKTYYIILDGNQESVTSSSDGKITLDSKYYGKSISLVLGNYTHENGGVTYQYTDSPLESFTLNQYGVSSSVTARTDTTLTLSPVTNGLYSIDGGLSWQSSNVFTSLTKNTDYTIQVKTDTDSQGFASDPISIQTKTKDTCTMETIGVDYSNDSLTGFAPSTRYNINGFSYLSDASGVISTHDGQDISSLFSHDGGLLSVDLTIYKEETDAYVKSASITITKDTNQAAAPDVSGMTFESDPSVSGQVVVHGFSVGDEYSTDGGSTWTSVTSTTLSFDPTTSLLIRHPGSLNQVASESASYTVASIGTIPNGSIDYTNDKITGLVPNASYYINGTLFTASSAGEITIPSTYFGTTINLIKKATSTETNSPKQPFTLSKLEAPTGINEVTRTNTTLSVTAVDGCEYSIDNGATWQSSNVFTTDGNGNPLEEGTSYTILTRKARTSASFESDPVSTTLVTRKTPVADLSTEVAIDYVQEELTGLTPSTT